MKHPKKYIYLSQNCDFSYAWERVDHPFAAGTTASFICYSGKSNTKVIDITAVVKGAVLSISLTKIQIDDLVGDSDTDLVESIGRYDLILTENGIKTLLDGGNVLLQRSFNRVK
jgi:hypothetical protein